MRARLLRVANALSESYWFVPTLMAIAALLLAAAMVWVDSHHLASWMDRLPWLYAARPAGARSLLSSIGGSMIGVAGTTFSVTIAAVVYASGQYGPRLLSNFMSDRGNQVTLGTFIATFIYSLVVVRTIRSAGEASGQAAFVPQLAVLVGVVLVLCSIAVLIYFIHHVPSRIHINSVIERIGVRLLREIDERFPASGDHAEALGSMTENLKPEGCRHEVSAADTGYLQLIDVDELVDIAQRAGLMLRLPYQPGDFVRRGSPLVESFGELAPDDKAAEAIRAAFGVGSRRTALQDLRFLIDELVEIAARALSPGVNDPFTANSCLDWLGAALAALVDRDMPSRWHRDEEGCPRVLTLPVTFAGLLDRSIGALTQYAASDRIAGEHLLSVLGDVALGCARPEELAIIGCEVKRFRDLVQQALEGTPRDRVTARANALLEALNGPHHRQRLLNERARGAMA